MLGTGLAAAFWYEGAAVEEAALTGLNTINSAWSILGQSIHYLKRGLAALMEVRGLSRAIPCGISRSAGPPYRFDWAIIFRATRFCLLSKLALTGWLPARLLL
jgi:hypothetical protein